MPKIHDIWGHPARHARCQKRQVINYERGGYLDGRLFWRAHLLTHLWPEDRWRCFSRVSDPPLRARKALMNESRNVTKEQLMLFGRDFEHVPKFRVLDVRSNSVSSCFITKDALPERTNVSFVTFLYRRIISSSGRKQAHKEADKRDTWDTNWYRIEGRKWKTSWLTAHVS